jgi:protein SCO1/2
MSPIAKTVALCAVFITIVLAMFVYSVTRTPQLSEEELRQRGVFVLPTPRDIAPFELTDHTGAAFDNESLQGKWSFVFFGFTHCPDVCPTSMAELGRVDRELQQADPELGQGFQGVLVTVDPERDTADKLGQYATAFSPRFLGVRGSRDATAKLAEQLNVAFAKVPDDAGGYTMDHTGYIVIINPYGHYHGFIKLPHKAETIRLTYQTLAAEIQPG